MNVRLTSRQLVVDPVLGWAARVDADAAEVRSAGTAGQDRPVPARVVREQVREDDRAEDG
jgi:hypothetical protein